MNRKLRPSCIDRTAGMDRTARRRAVAGVCWLAAISAGGIGVAAGEDLFVSKPLTPAKEYTSHIEGPAVNAAGDLFVANIKMPGAGDDGGAIGRVKSGATTSELFAILPKFPSQNGVQGIGNGIRFDQQDRMYVADFKNHIIHVFEPGPTTTRRDYFVARPNNQGKPAFNQPNDLAIARDGTLYASDPKSGTGRIWKITKAADGTVTGKPMTSTRTMGRTNGLDLSPDNKTLYVSESKVGAQRASVWAYRINGMALADPVSLKVFTEGGDVDGLRVDTDGRIFVARPEASQIFILVPPGAVGTAPAPVTTQGKNPTNLTFGGADGRDVYVTQADDHKLFIERFRTDRPGREPCLRTPAPADCRPVAP
jgi:sugar lactone lactonase YvrE